jgi:hypothetical protein
MIRKLLTAALLCSAIACAYADPGVPVYPGAGGSGGGGGGSSGPYASVVLTTGQDVTGSYATLAFDTVTLDPSNAWDATNHKWVPQTAGTYQVCAYADAGGTFAANQGFTTTVQKDGATQTTVRQWAGAAGGDQNSVGTVGGCALVALNGSTDGVEAGVSTLGTGVITQPQFTFMSVNYVGP